MLLGTDRRGHHNIGAKNMQVKNKQGVVSLILSVGFAVVTVFALSACPDDKPVVPKPECSSAADCDGPAADIGRLCRDGKCVACASAEDCAADARYGEAAVCIDGLCTTCVDGEVGCSCLDGQYCIEGSGCDSADGLCHPCQPGQALCACDDGGCDDGLSCADDDICRADSCSPGQADCACDNGDCPEGLVCGEDSCRACPDDVEGCPCNSDGSCDINMVCDSDSQTCRAPTSCTELDCGEHRLCGDDSGSFACLEDCATGYRWNSTEQNCEIIPAANCNEGAEASILADCQSAHRVCVESGDSAHCGACVDDGSECWLGPADEADGACRAPVTCADCDTQHRDCTAADACGDASCGDCSLGYHAEGDTCVEHTYVSSCDECATAHRACVNDAGGDYCGDCLDHWEEVSGSCTGVANCEAGADNSILADCDVDHRSCVEATAIADAHCGDCQADYLEDTDSGLCILDTTCHGDEDCMPEQGWHCVQSTTSDSAHCRKTQCEEAGEAWDRLHGTCIVCGTCDATNPALTGNVWPVTDRNGNCYCETSPGYYWDSSNGSTGAFACDADGDGWINQTVAQILSDATPASGEPDMTPIVNARCDFEKVYSFILVNEWGQQKVLDVGDTFGAQTGGLDYVILYETTRNDRDDQGVLPQYRGTRRFSPAEVNGLTKACINTSADLNDNQVSDYLEKQTSPATTPWQNVFNRLGFYTELFSGQYQDGQYYITARSRCDLEASGLPLRYSANDPQMAQGDDSYWRSCTRRRDRNFDHTNPLGYDFARYDLCGDVDGACDYSWLSDWKLAAPGTRPTPQPPLGVASWSEVQPHGVCDGLDLSMEPWRGMGHAEQFDCVQAKATVEAGHPEQVELNDLYISGTSGHLLQANVCKLDENSLGIFSCTQPDDATSLSYLQDQVFWVARRFEPYSTPADYTGGCIDEWAEWRQLCPGYLTSSAPEDTIKGEGQVNNFGELVCGCSSNYGGLDCSLGCPDDQLLLSDDYQVSPRQGSWMCAQIAASEATPLVEPDVDGGYRLIGSVPAHAGGTAVLSDGDDGGYTLR